MRIRRKSEKVVESDGVPPLHTLITCTYQKLFKKDGEHGGGNEDGVAETHGTSETGKANIADRHRKQRHECGSWAHRRRVSRVCHGFNSSVSSALVWFSLIVVVIT